MHVRVFLVLDRPIIDVDPLRVSVRGNLDRGIRLGLRARPARCVTAPSLPAILRRGSAELQELRRSRLRRIRLIVRPSQFRRVRPVRRIDRMRRLWQDDPILYAGNLRDQRRLAG